MILSNALVSILKRCAYFTLFFSVLCAFSATAMGQNGPAKKNHSAAQRLVKKPSGSKKKRKSKSKIQAGREVNIEEQQMILDTLASTRIPHLACKDMPFKDFVQTFIHGTLHMNEPKFNVGIFGDYSTEQHQKFISKKLTLELDDISIAELLEILRQLFGIGYSAVSYDITIDESGICHVIQGNHADKIEENRAFLKRTRIQTPDIRGVSLADMLAYMRLTIRKNGGTINIVPLFGESDSVLYQQYMSKKLSFKHNDISLEKLFTILRRKAGITYEIVPYGVIIRPENSKKKCVTGMPPEKSHSGYPNGPGSDKGVEEGQ